MKTPLRLRLFYWLVTLLLLFVALQFVIFVSIEFRAWVQHPDEPLREHFMEAVWGVIWDLATLPILIGVAWLISRRMIEPIRAVTLAADNIRNGHFQERIATTDMPADEMRRMAATVNAAFDHYRDAVERLRRFSGDASHQLRTPLAAMQSIGEVTLSRNRTPEEYRQALVNMLEAVQRLSRVTDQLLRLARLERTEVQTSFQSVDVSQVARRTAEIFTPLCEEKQILFRVEAEDGLHVQGDEDLLLEMIANLLDNALRVTPHGGTILLRVVTESGSEVLITVADTGPGIAPEFAEHVFELFAQIPGALPTGAGLGLAIVSAIAKAHGGRAELNPQQASGAAFRVRLPRVGVRSIDA